MCIRDRPKPKPKPNLPPRLDSLLRQTIGSNLPSTAEIQLFESPERWVAVRAAPAEGSAVITLADTTERRRQEEALQSSEQSLQLAARMAKIGAWRVDFDPPGIWWSPEVRRIHAVPDDYEPDLESIFAFYPPESRARLRELFNRSVETGEEFDGEFDFRDARGRVVWVRLIGQAERDPSTGKTIRVHGTFQDITETHESAIALAESREMLSVAFWGASLSVSDCRFDTGEFVFDANLLRLLGYEKREVVPTLKFRDSLMPEADRRRWAESLEACLEGRAQLFECEYRLAAKDGSFRWLLERSKIVSLDTSNRPARMVGIITDITRLKEAEELVASALEHEKDLARKAQAASKAKKDFLAMMSHEIRTPLNSVLGFAEMLAGRPLDSESAEYVRTIRESGESLLRILNDILDYSRIESGKLQIEERAYNPRSVLRSVVDLLKPIALSKGIELAASNSDDVPEAVLGDEMRVKQVLVNLAGNAVKFTSKGVVNLRLHLDEDGRNLVFSVRDTGPGIAAAKLESIFEPFTQADASISRAHGGTGLGLAISSQLVHLMDGTIRAKSALGKGSEFAFSIPLRAAPAEASPPASDVLVPGEASFAKNLPLRILIVEDDRVNARLTRLILTRLGYSPAIVHDGRQAVEAAASDPPDLILMDLRMPNMDGLEATRAIRAVEAERGSRPRIFIAALTADVLPEGRDQSFDAGMDDYVTKPVSSAKILEVLRKAALQKNPAAPA
ncbi:MAG: ATP-binding protein, partial [Terrimicrobiaceae bacterium]|nr:ATP-binding protein [Terrimicrobiaceae bacterium]